MGAVEGAILDGLRAWVGAYEARGDAPEDAPAHRADDAARAQLMEQLATLEAQAGRLFDLLERGVYDVATFRARRADLDARIAATRDALGRLDAPASVDPVAAIVPQARTVLGAYSLAASPADKNALLRTVLDHVAYTKTQRCYRNNGLTDHLKLTLFPRVYSPDTQSDNPGV